MKFKKFNFENYLLFVVTVPTLFLGGIFNGASTLRGSSIFFPCLFLLGISYVLFYSFKKNPPTSPGFKILNISLWGFFVLGVLQFLLALLGFSTLLASQTLYRTYSALPHLFIFILLFFYFYQTFLDEKRILFFLNSAILLAVLLFIFGLLSSSISSKWLILSSWNKLNFSSTFYDRNTFSFFLNLIYPFALATTCQKISDTLNKSAAAHPLGQLLSRPEIILKLLGVVTIGLAIGLSGSHAATTIFLLISFSVVIVSLIVNFKENRKSFLITLLVFIFIFLALIIFYMLAGFTGSLESLIGWYSNIIMSFQEKYTMRYLVILSYIKSLPQYFWFGTGLGTFAEVFSEYQLPSLSGYYRMAHVEYVELLMETGIVGFILALGIPVILGLQRLIRIIKKWQTIPKTTLILLIGITGGLINAGIHSWSNFSLDYPVVLFLYTALAGAYFALTENIPTIRKARLKQKQAQSNAEKTELKAEGKTKKILSTILLVLFSILFLLLFFTQIKSKFLTKERKYNKALKFNPFNKQANLRELKLLLKNNAPDSSAIQNKVNWIIKIAPSAETYYVLGNIFKNTGHAQLYYWQTSEMAPAKQHYALLRLIESNITLLENFQKNPKHAAVLLSQTNDFIEKLGQLKNINFKDDTKFYFKQIILKKITNSSLSPYYQNKLIQTTQKNLSKI